MAEGREIVGVGNIRISGLRTYSDLDKFADALFNTASSPPRERGGLDRVNVFAEVNEIGADSVRKTYQFTAHFDEKMRGGSNEIRDRVRLSYDFAHDRDDGAFDIPQYIQEQLKDIGERATKRNPKMNFGVHGKTLVVDSLFRALHSM